MAENHAGTDTGTDTVTTVDSDATDDARTNPAPAEKRASTLSRLYTGTGAFDIVGRRRLFYAIVGATLLIAIGSMLFRGFVFGIEFEGGTQLQFPAGSATVTQVEDTYRGALGKDPVTVQTVGTGSSTTVQIRSETLSQDQVGTLKQALLDRFQPVAASGQPSVDAISDSAVSESWGGEITQKALVALVVFLVLVSLFIGFRYERDMAIAALAALVHDLVLTAGIYSLVGFEVTPATVIGLLTILGFSLYDTVVVFDKVQENTRGVLSLTRRTYAEQANLAINQTLMRSLNTTVIAVLPVLGLLAVGVGLLGVGTLKDLALVQLTGLLAGAYSSIFIATPLLVTLKERRGEVAEHTRRVMARRAGTTTGAGARAASVPAAAVRSKSTVGRPRSAAAKPKTAAATRPKTAARRPTGKPNGKRKR